MAAGAARRLGAWGERNPKCLLEFDGRTLLARHLEHLQQVGVRRVTVITGFLAERVEQAGRGYAGPPIDFLRNERLEDGNLISMRLGLTARADTSHDLLLMDADVLYEPALLRGLIESDETCLLLDPSSASTGEEMIVGVRAGRARTIRRGSPGSSWDLQGEAVGFTRVVAEDVGRLMAAADALIDAGQSHLECESALDLFLQARPAAFSSVAGLAWLEIDFPADVERAEREVLPQLRVREAAGRTLANACV